MEFDDHFFQYDTTKSVIECVIIYRDFMICAACLYANIIHWRQTRKSEKSG